MANYEEMVIQDARLVILKELAKQTDGRLNQSILLEVLDSFGHKRSRDWLGTQLRAMKELGAIQLHEAGTILIAELTQAGQDHLDRRSIIEGIKRPSLAKG